MKVVAAMAQAEAVKARENEALKRFEVIQKEIEHMKVATADALKRAEMAEAGVEGSGRRAPKVARKETEEKAAQTLAKPKPCRSQKQNPPDKNGSCSKAEKIKSLPSQKRRFCLISAVASINEIDSGYPSPRIGSGTNMFGYLYI
ncbi:hypothetical protein V6N13_031703 [Hibiscus sabdariffa]|uniref:Uncharacterized protein n=2 Tax=Hibiscus sabdariffa TaxID=183260 RepID=A0ABR2CJJ3_9ROSI